MSFILDALKKSETDRLRRDEPGYAHIPDKTQHKSASHWIWIVVVLIVINIAVLAVLFLKPGNAPESAATAMRSAPAPIASATSTAQAESAAVLAEASGDRAASRPAEPQAIQEITRSVPPVSQNPVINSQQNARPSATVAKKDSFDVTESFANFDDLRLQGLLNLPDLHLDIHVFSERPGDRFVFVNMSKYKEGAKLDEGPYVSEITPFGVVLEHRGLKFNLPRE